MAYSQKNNMVSEKNMGTDTDLANYVNRILKGLDEKQYTVSIFMDLSKAFEVLNHKILNKETRTLRI